MSQIGKKYNRHEALRPSTDSSEAREAEEAEAESIAGHHVISKSSEHTSFPFQLRANQQ